MKRDLAREEEDDEASMFTEENNVPVSERRTIRSEYRKLETLINERKDEIANGDCNKFMVLMNEVENMHQPVEKPREQVADAEALFGLTSSLVAFVKTHSTGDITPADFISCLLRYFGRPKIMNDSPYISWKTIGNIVSPIFMNAPTCMTMIGPMSTEIKRRKIAVRAKRTRLSGKAQPKELEKEVEEVIDTDRNMQVMFGILKKHKKVKIENLMLNRNSFAQTVENLFALSFLVKDGRVSIHVDENGSQVIVPRNGPSAEEIRSGTVKHHQFIFRFDFADCKVMQTLVREGEELMPERNVPTDGGVAKPGAGDNKGFSAAEGITSDSEILRTAPIKKFSRNFGHSTQNSGLTEVGDIIMKNWNGKKKRSHL